MGVWLEKDCVGTFVSKLTAFLEDRFGDGVLLLMTRLIRDLLKLSNLPGSIEQDLRLPGNKHSMSEVLDR